MKIYVPLRQSGYAALDNEASSHERIASGWKALQLRGNSQVLWENGGYWMFSTLIAVIFLLLLSLSAPYVRRVAA